MYINNLRNIIFSEDKNITFIANDIYKLTLILIEKYKCNIGYKILSKLETNDDLELLNFLYKLFDVLFSIKSEEDLENDDEISEDEDNNEEEGSESEEEVNDINNINKNENNIYIYIKIKKEEKFDLFYLLI